MTGMEGYGHTQRNISVPESGLYYMWVYFSGDNIKNVYGYILVDNLEPDIAVEEVTLPKTQTIKLGTTLNLNLNFKPSNATNKIVTWSSSNENIATVDNSGKVTPKKTGSTIITVVSEDGNKKANCTITVTEVQDNKQPISNTDNKDNQTDDNKNNTNNGNNNQGNNNNDKTNNQPANTNKDSGKNDKTTAPIKKIPQAGQTVIITIVGFVVLIGISIIMYKKFSQYKDIK